LGSGFCGPKIIRLLVSIITGAPNGPAFFARWRLSLSVVVVSRLSSSVTLPMDGRASRRARGRSGSRHCTAGQ